MGTHRYSLPIVSGILLALAFYPFYFWPLAFAALAPLFHFAAQTGRRRRELFFGGFLCGLIGVAPTAYSSLFQMRLLQGDELFSYLVRASALPMLALIACAFGALALSFALLRSRSWLFNSLIGAALYGALELGFMRLLGGYYLPSLSYAVAGFAPAFTFASIAGAGFAALLVAWVNSLVSEAVVAYRVKGHVPLSGIAIALACACALYCGAKFYSGALPQNGPAISAAVVQE
ncbi:MAG TPA: hypothetical protein VN701_02570, partial [Candidatus Paceibacterota bacterium]|nr:hypothetical protein [Candidatus Paceibacterota bacterium]